MTRRAVVTGAAGFIGSHLSERLVVEGYRVIGIDAFTDHYSRDAKRANLSRLATDDRFELLETDLASPSARHALADVVDGATVVYHLAGQPGVRTSWADGFESHLRDNVLSTQNLLEACTRTGCGRFVLASSSSVYGRRTEPTPMREDDPLRPYSPYAVTKASAEQLCRTYLENHGVPTVILRYFTVYGPRQRPDMAFRRFIRRILDGEPVPVFGDGEQTRDYTYVDDAVAGTMLAAEATPGTVVNLGSGRPATLNAVLDAIGDILGAFERTAPGKQPGDVPHTLADISVAGGLGYTPVTDLRDGLEAQVGWQRGG